MIWLEVLILAVIQGIAEFLPISSSGHLVVGAALMETMGGEPLDEKLTVSIVLHAGTLMSILAFYWRRLWTLLEDDRGVIGRLAVGSIPAAVAGLVLKKHFEPLLESPLVAGLMFPITGLFLLWMSRQKTGETTCRQLSYPKALLIGLFQAFAIMPGISRSGSTIVAGVGCGMRREEAATFSFFLAIPAIGGALLLDLRDAVGNSAAGVPVGPLAIGALASFIVGFLSLWLLVRFLRQGRLHLFAWWVIPLGVVVVVWQLLG